jgi:hypothetical protein
MYIYAIVINTGKTSYAPTAGSIDLTWYGSNHLDGTLLGVYYKGIFYSVAPSIAPGTSYYAIYKMNQATMKMDNPPPQGGGTLTSIMWWGDASITDGSGSNAEDQSYFAGTLLLSGLWMRSKC